MPRSLSERDEFDVGALDALGEFRCHVRERYDGVPPLARGHAIDDVDDAILQPADAELVDDVDDERRLPDAGSFDGHVSCSTD